MPATDRKEKQFSLALESIQGRRRAEMTVAAANALVARFAGEHDPVARLRLAHELIRRNFAPDIRLGLAPTTPADAAGSDPGEKTFLAEITGPDATLATLSAAYPGPGDSGRTVEEWRTALTLLAGVAALGAGGWLSCP